MTRLSPARAALLLAILVSLPCRAQYPAPIERIDFRTLEIDGSPGPLVFLTRGDKEVPISLYPGQRSDFYTYRGTRPLPFYAPGVSALPPEQRKPLLTADIPAQFRHPLLVFLHPDKPGGSWRIAVCDDSTTEFGPGTLRLFNTLQQPVKVDVSGVKFDLPPLQFHDLTPVLLKDNMFEISLQANAGDGWRETYRSVWDMPAGWRVFGLLVLENSKPVFMKVVETGSYAQSVEGRIAADKAKDKLANPGGAP